MNDLPNDILLVLFRHLDTPTFLALRAWYPPPPSSPPPPSASLTDPPASNRHLHALATTHQSVIIASIASRFTPLTRELDSPISNLSVLQHVHVASEILHIVNRALTAHCVAYWAPHENRTDMEKIRNPAAPTSLACMGLNAFFRFARLEASREAEERSIQSAEERSIQPAEEQAYNSVAEALRQSVRHGVPERDNWRLRRFVNRMDPLELHGLLFIGDILRKQGAEVVVKGLDIEVRRMEERLWERSFGGRWSLWERFGVVVRKKCGRFVMLASRHVDLFPQRYERGVEVGQGGTV